MKLISSPGKLHSTVEKSAPPTAPQPSRLEQLEQAREADRSCRAGQKEAAEQRINRGFWIWMPLGVLVLFAVKTFVVFPARKLLATPGMTPAESFWLQLQNFSGPIVLVLFFAALAGWTRHLRDVACVHTAGESDPEPASLTLLIEPPPGEEDNPCSSSSL